MTIPMLLLSVGALFGGLFFVYVGNIVEWLEPITGFEPFELPIPELLLEVSTLLIVAIGIFLAWRQYATRPVPQQPPQQVSVMTVAARNSLYDDAFNEAVFMRPGQYLTRWLVWFDNQVVDGAVRGFAGWFSSAGDFLRRIQTGFARSYALSMVVGAVVIGAVFVIARWF